MPKQKPEILKVFYNGEELIIYSYHCAYKSMNSFLHYITYIDISQIQKLSQDIWIWNKSQIYIRWQIQDLKKGNNMC